MCALTSKIRRVQLNILPQTLLLESVLRLGGSLLVHLWGTCMSECKVAIDITSPMGEVMWGFFRKKVGKLCCL